MLSPHYNAFVLEVDLEGRHISTTEPKPVTAESTSPTGTTWTEDGRRVQDAASSKDASMKASPPAFLP